MLTSSPAETKKVLCILLNLGLLLVVLVVAAILLWKFGKFRAAAGSTRAKSQRAEHAVVLLPGLGDHPPSFLKSLFLNELASPAFRWVVVKRG